MSTHSLLRSKVRKHLLGLGCYEQGGTGVGAADLNFCCSGRWLSLEIKTGAGRATPTQRSRIRQIRGAGGWGWVCRSVPEAQRAYELVIQGVRVMPEDELGLEELLSGGAVAQKVAASNALMDEVKANIKAPGSETWRLANSESPVVRVPVGKGAGGVLEQINESINRLDATMNKMLEIIEGFAAGMAADVVPPPEQVLRTVRATPPPQAEKPAEFDIGELSDLGIEQPEPAVVKRRGRPPKNPQAAPAKQEIQQPYDEVDDLLDGLTLEAPPTRVALADLPPGLAAQSVADDDLNFDDLLEGL